MADTTEKYDLNNTTTNGSSPLQQAQSKPYENGHYGPLAHVNTAENRLPAFGGEFQPGLYRSPRNRKIGNPAPLGLCAFALTTFILGCIQMQVRGISQPNIIVGSALGYGGLVQLLAGMWYVLPIPYRDRGRKRWWKANRMEKQGNGRRKHLRRNGPLLLRWILDLRRHHLHTRWFRSHDIPGESRRRADGNVL